MELLLPEKISTPPPRTSVVRIVSTVADVAGTGKCFVKTTIIDSIVVG